MSVELFFMILYYMFPYYFIEFGINNYSFPNNLQFVTDLTNLVSLPYIIGPLKTKYDLCHVDFYFELGFLLLYCTCKK